MFFTREDINKIYQALLKLGIKDSELPETSDVKNDDTLAIVQDGKNKQINIREFFNNISLFKKEGFINITDRFNKPSISLIEAIQSVPIHQRINGLVITFEDINKDWRIYQFRGNKGDFFKEDKWLDLYDYTNWIVDSITPDEEDLTTTKPDGNGNALVHLKDRAYDKSNFSGKGYKILRKNIQTIDGVRKNILTQDMINDPNTIYEIRYDFDLNGANIDVNNCTLNFNSGSLNNGIINFNNSLLEGNIQIGCYCTGNISNPECNVSWFLPKADGITNDTLSFQSALNICNNVNVPSGKFLVTLQNRDATTHNDINGIYISRSNVHIKMQQDTILKGKVDDSIIKPDSGYIGYDSLYGNVIKIGSLNTGSFIENISIEGGTLFGVRDEFGQPLNNANEENQCGISAKYVKNLTIKNCVIKDNQGDSIIVYNCDGVNIINNISSQARRTGISLGPCNNVTIDNCKFINDGCDIEYDGIISYATGPQYGICFEGDEPIQIFSKSFKNIIIKNCYCEFIKNKVPATDITIAARNDPGFCLISQLADGGENIVIKDCNIVNKDSDSSNAILVSLGKSTCDRLLLENNKYTSLVNTIEYISMYFILTSNISDIIIKSNVCTSNTNFISLGGASIGSPQIGNILIENNKIIKQEYSNEFAVINNTKIAKVSIINNDIIGEISIVNDSIMKDAIICNNIINCYDVYNGSALINIDLPNDTNVSFKDNICQIYVKPVNVYYIVKNVPKYLNSLNNVVDTDRATKIGGPTLYVENNIVNISGSENVFFSNDPILGFIQRNIFNIPESNLTYYGIRELPLNKKLYIQYNYFNNSNSTPILLDTNKDIIYTYNSYPNKFNLGTTDNRPILTKVDNGFTYFDTNLNKQIQWNGTSWIDLNGNPADTLTQGTTAQRPTEVKTGFQYYDTALKKYIVWNGTEWTNMDGTAL